MLNHLIFSITINLSYLRLFENHFSNILLVVVTPDLLRKSTESHPKPNFSRKFLFNNKSVFLNLFIFINFSFIAFASPDKNWTETDSKNRKISILVRGTLINYPSSVTAIKRDLLQQPSLNSLSDITQLVPNFTWSGATSRPRFLQIRGVGDLEQYEGIPSNRVTTMLDGVDLSGISSSYNLFDIEQIEVYRGPQPSKFASNGIGGTIVMTTPKLSSENPLIANLSVGSGEFLKTGIALGQQISNGADYRFTINKSSGGSFWFNEYLDTDGTNKHNESLGRIKLSKRISPDFSTTLLLQKNRQINGFDAFSIDNNRVTHSDNPGKDNEKLDLFYINNEFYLGKHIILESLTSYYDYNQIYSYDGDWGNQNYWGINAPYDFFSMTTRSRSSFAELLTAKDLKQDWRISAYYQNLSENSEIKEFEQNVIYDSLESTYNRQTVSLFGDKGFDLGLGLSLNIGARLEEQNSSYFDNRIDRLSPSDLLFGYSAKLQRSLTDKSFSYFGFSRGFKGGGINSDSSLSEDLILYNPESLINYEFGINQDPLKVASPIKASIFYYHQYQHQLGLSEQNNPSDPLSFNYFTGNGADSIGYGSEVEYLLRLSRSFSLDFSGSILKTDFIRTKSSIDYLTKRSKAFAPSWQNHIAAIYKPNQKLTLNLSINSLDKFYFSEADNSRSNQSSTMNFVSTYQHNQVAISLWFKNILNHRNQIKGFYFGIEPPNFPSKSYYQLNEPFSFGVNLDLRL